MGGKDHYNDSIAETIAETIAESRLRARCSLTPPAVRDYLEMEIAHVSATISGDHGQSRTVPQAHQRATSFSRDQRDRIQKPLL